MHKILNHIKSHIEMPPIIRVTAIGIFPFIFAMSILHLWKWDFSIPLVYSGSDDVWQLILTKVLKDTGWILDNPFLGAPDVAHWHANPAAQTSSLHSLIMLGMSNFIDDAVRLQQIYYVLNFSLITLSCYVACRLLGLSRVTSTAIGILFSFTSFRIGWAFYAFLANYFAVPLGMVPVLWVLLGKFGTEIFDSNTTRGGIAALMRSGSFWLSIFFIALITLSDGYYAFFTLLLLGFATIIRIVSGDFKAPARLIAPFIFIAVLGLLALAMITPLTKFQSNHFDEFYPDGKADSAVLKRPFEAEVYSASIKLLVAPIPEHRIASIGSFGQHMINTSNEAKKFPQDKPIVSLGTLGAALLISCIIFSLFLFAQRAVINNRFHVLPDAIENNPVFWGAITLSLFILLCSTTGGIGSLIALGYPTIRAYDRFPLFMFFCLLLAAGAIVTGYQKHASKRRSRILVTGIFFITLASLYDQIPYNAAKGSAEVSKRFLAERNFVQKVENLVPTGSMIYQYPHSQYLSDNKYYGWGSFSHIRLYLHSKTLRWSNGATKNSPVDNWHDRIKGLPVANLLGLVEAVGFRGLVIDRAVVPSKEYAAMRSAVIQRGLELFEDADSQLSFVKLNDPGYQIFYDSKFRTSNKLLITDRKLAASGYMPNLINKSALQELLSNIPSDSKLEILQINSPQIFNSAKSLNRGVGDSPIEPITDMAGTLSCKIESGSDVANRTDTIVLNLTNASAFDWQLGQGKLPIGVGVHVRDLQGVILNWDNGIRVSTNSLLEKGQSTKLRFPLRIMDFEGAVSDRGTVIAEFGLVQDGHAWFTPISCRVKVN